MLQLCRTNDSQPRLFIQGHLEGGAKDTRGIDLQERQTAITTNDGLCQHVVGFDPVQRVSRMGGQYHTMRHGSELNQQRFSNQ